MVSQPEDYGNTNNTADSGGEQIISFVQYLFDGNSPESCITYERLYLLLNMITSNRFGQRDTILLYMIADMMVYNLLSIPGNPSNPSSLNSMFMGIQILQSQTPEDPIISSYITNSMIPRLQSIIRIVVNNRSEIEDISEIIAESFAQEKSRIAAEDNVIEKVYSFRQKWEFNIHGDTCCICCENFKDMADLPMVVICSRCKHTFCADCIVNHLKYDYRCPICRNDMNETVNFTSYYPTISDAVVHISPIEELEMIYNNDEIDVNRKRVKNKENRRDQRNQTRKDRYKMRGYKKRYMNKNNYYCRR